MVIIQDIELIKQFVDKYNSAQASLDGHNTIEAKQKYKELLHIYSAINKSKLEKEHKELAYEQVMKVYREIHRDNKGITGTVSAVSNVSQRFTSKSMMIVAGLLILLSLVVFIKPEIIGLVLEPSIVNTPPAWTAPEIIFDVRAPETRINLDNYFADSEGSKLVYLATSARNINVEVSGSQLIITPEPGAFGTREITVVASDGIDTTKKTIKLNIIQAPFNLGR
ncbi:MAG: hypothetical protein QW666_01710 [Candidatus Woesearchaeota archaeon]